MSEAPAAGDALADQDAPARPDTHADPDVPGPGDTALRERLDAIVALPLAERAAAFAELHERLGAHLDDDSDSDAALFADSPVSPLAGASHPDA